MEKKWIYVYGWLSAFTVHLKLSQHGLLITYTPIKSKKSKQKKRKKKMRGILLFSPKMSLNKGAKKGV